jgi:hypothetical protein
MENVTVLGKKIPEKIADFYLCDSSPFLFSPRRGGWGDSAGCTQEMF